MSVGTGSNTQLHKPLNLLVRRQEQQGESTLCCQLPLVIIQPFLAIGLPLLQVITEASECGCFLGHESVHSGLEVCKNAVLEADFRFSQSTSLEPLGERRLQFQARVEGLLRSAAPTVPFANGRVLIE